MKHPNFLCNALAVKSPLPMAAAFCPRRLLTLALATVALGQVDDFRRLGSLAGADPA